MENCIFCKIASEELASYKIWENDGFLAFLSIFPEIEGMTIVIPKKHYDSYVFKADKEIVVNLMEASREVANLLDSKLENVLRTKLVFEGLEVNHLHAKLYPLYKEKKILDASDTVKASDKELSEIANKLTS